MDFVSYIRNQHEKLTSSEYVSHLWNELEGGQNDTPDVAPEACTDYTHHLPLVVEDFWQLALEKLDKSPALEEIDDNLKIYLVTLIYHCISQGHESISDRCVVYCAEVYLHLLATAHGDDFFKSKLYTSTLNTVQTLTQEAKADRLIASIVRKLGCFLKRAGGLSGLDLEVTLATLVQVIFLTSREVCKEFDDVPPEAPGSHQALACLRNLLVQETLPSRKFIITTYLFNGLRKHSAVPLTAHAFNIIQTSFRHLIKNLHPKFKEDHYKTFLNAFIHVWKHPDFSFYVEAVTVMNNLKEKHYRTLVDVLNKQLMGTSPHKNMFKLALAIICCPPRYSPLEKVVVTNQVLLGSILLHCISPNGEIFHCATESLAEILMSPDLEKEHVKESVKLLFNSTGQSVSVPMLLGGFQCLIRKKWATKSKNKHIFAILLSVMVLSDTDYPETYGQILHMLSEEATPFDFKPFIPVIMDAYIKLSDNGRQYSALQLLKILHKMALHPMATSNEFVKTLYMAMTSVTMYKIPTTTKREIFITPIISREFNFSELFLKCHTLGLIRDDHVSQLLKNIAFITQSDLKFLCSILHLTEYKDLTPIANYINSNFTTICQSGDLKYFFYMYRSVLRNRKDSMCTTHSDLKSNEIILCFLKHHLGRQSLHWNCVSNAFALLVDLAEFTNLSEDFTRLKQTYDMLLTSSLDTKDTFVPSLYYSQLVIFGKVVPSDANLQIINHYLHSCSDSMYRRSADFNQHIWIACLLLYTNISTVRTSMTDNCFHFLQQAMNSSVTWVKLAVINMYFDLCNMVTHSFEDLTTYMFKQLVYGDTNLRKTCLLKIDRLVRDDYLKLELDQFLIFVSTLGDKIISEYGQQLLSEHFFISNAAIIARFFVPLVVHLNGYKRHPMYEVSDDVHDLIQVVSKNMSRRKVYNLLLGSMPIKFRFSIITVMATNILERVMKGTIKHGEGFWEMIKDCLLVYKLMTINSNTEGPGDDFYKTVVGQINKFIINRAECGAERLHSEYGKEILHGTQTLLRLLVFNDSDTVQRHLRLPLFDAIMHWTYFLLAELVHLVHVERCKDIQNWYIKVEAVFKQNEHELEAMEEPLEYDRGASRNIDTSGSSLFEVSQGFVPSFVDS